MKRKKAFFVFLCMSFSHTVVDLVLFERMLLSQISSGMLEATLILIDSHTQLFY